MTKNLITRVVASFSFFFVFFQYLILSARLLNNNSFIIIPAKYYDSDNESINWEQAES